MGMGYTIGKASLFCTRVLGEAFDEEEHHVNLEVLLGSGTVA